LPDPMSVAASARSRVWIWRSTTSAPALAASSANSASDSSVSNGWAAFDFSSSPARIAFSI
jgi:hypothetical protein